MISNILKTSNAKSTMGTYIIKMASSFLGFCITYLLSRWLGMKEYGVYAYVLAWIQILLIPTTFGFPQLLVRNFSVYRTKKKWSKLSGLWNFSNGSILLTSFVIVGIAELIFIYMEVIADPTLKLTFQFGCLLLPIMALSQNRQSAMRGFDKTIEGQIPELIIRPFIFILFILIVFSYFRASFKAQYVIVFYSISGFISMAVGYLWYKKIAPSEIKLSHVFYERKIWLMAAIPLLVVNGLNIVSYQSDTILLGILKGNVLVGNYSVVKKIVDLIRFFLISINVAIAPSIASLYAEKNYQRLQKVITRSSRVVFLFTLIAVVVATVFWSPILEIFGEEYLQGKSALIILSISQLINAFAGPVGLVLIMVNYENYVVYSVSIAIVISISIGLILIPLLGMDGAAISTLIGTVVRNGILIFLINKKLKINSTALGNI